MAKIFGAAETNDVEKLKLLIKAHFDLNIQNQMGKTALHLAAQKGHEQIVELLVENKANVNARDIDKATPLLLASSKSHVNVVDLLINADADVNAANSYYQTALHLCCTSNSLATAEYLLLAGAEVDAVDSKGQTALHYASISGNVPLIQLLVRTGAAVDASDHCRVRALHIAAMHGHELAVDCLLESNAEVDVRDVNRTAPLHHAFSAGRLSIVLALIRAGANLGAKDHSGKLPHEMDSAEKIRPVLLKHVLMSYAKNPKMWSLENTWKPLFKLHGLSANEVFKDLAALKIYPIKVADLEGEHDLARLFKQNGGSYLSRHVKEHILDGKAEDDRIISVFIKKPCRSSESHQTLRITLHTEDNYNCTKDAQLDDTHDSANRCDILQATVTMASGDIQFNQRITLSNQAERLEPVNSSQTEVTFHLKGQTKVCRVAVNRQFYGEFHSESKSSGFSKLKKSFSKQQDAPWLHATRCTVEVETILPPEKAYSFNQQIYPLSKFVLPQRCSITTSDGLFLTVDKNNSVAASESYSREKSLFDVEEFDFNFIKLRPAGKHDYVCFGSGTLGGGGQLFRIGNHQGKNSSLFSVWQQNEGELISLLLPDGTFLAYIDGKLITVPLHHPSCLFFVADELDKVLAMDISYNLNKKRIRHHDVLVALTADLHNSLDQPQEFQRTYTYEKKESGYWKTGLQKQTQARLLVKVRQVPKLDAAGTKVALQKLDTKNMVDGSSEEITKTIEETQKAVVGPGKSIRMRTVVNRAYINVPFTYTETHIHKNDKVRTYENKTGEYTNLESYSTSTQWLDIK